MAVLSVWDLDLGKTINFILTSGDGALHLSGGTVTMILDDGREYVCSTISAGSGTVEYTVSAQDFRQRRDLIGQLRVSFSTTKRFYTSTFELVVRRSIDKDPT